VVLNTTPTGETIPGKGSCLPFNLKERTMSMRLLQHLIEAFPQADPSSEFYNEEINGCEAVNFLSGFIPEVRKYIDDSESRENRSLATLKACWDFIENVTDDDPERNDKFFALREQVRNCLWDEEHEPPAVAIILEGGLVQCIVSDRPDDIQPMNLLLLDYDTEGADEDELLQVPQKDGSVSTATGRYLGFDQADIGLADVIEQLDKRGW